MLPALSTIENEILIRLAEGGTAQSVAVDLGIPPSAIAELKRKKGVKEYLEELKEARYDLAKSFAIGVLEATLRDQMDIIANDEEKRLATATKKDPVEVAKTLLDALKGTAGASGEQGNDPMAKIYANIALIQQNDNRGN